MTELPSPEILISRVIISGIILGLYVFDFAKVFDNYRDRRARWTGAPFRSVIRSSQILFGVMLIFMSAINGAFFVTNESPIGTFISTTLRYSGFVLLGMLLVGGLALVWSHLQGDE